MNMIIVALLAGLILVTGPPDSEKESGMPKHYQTYGLEISTIMMEKCMSVGRDRGYTEESLRGFCSCTVYSIEDKVTLPQLRAMNPAESTPLARGVAAECISIGLEPKKQDDPFPPGSVKV